MKEKGGAEMERTAREPFFTHDRGFYRALFPILTTIVVTFTMRGKLKAKPGDLIFERNN